MSKQSKLITSGITIIVFSTLNLQAQTAHKNSLPVDDATKLITYVKVQEVNGAGKDSLYNKALKWCMEYFINPNDVIREKDDVNGKIVCKARFKVMKPADKFGVAKEGGLVQYTLTLEFKDGRFRYEFTGFNWKQQSYYACEKWMDTSSQYYLPEFEAYLLQVDDRVKEISSSLIRSMTAKSPEKRKDW